MIHFLDNNKERLNRALSIYPRITFYYTTDNTTMIISSLPYFVFIPIDNYTLARWINLAFVREIQLVRKDPLTIHVFDENGEYYEITRDSAEALVKALTEFPHGKIIS